MLIRFSFDLGEESRKNNCTHYLLNYLILLRIKSFKKSFVNLKWKVLFWKAQHNAQKMKFSITDFFSKCDWIRSFLRIWSHILKKSVMENFNFLCSGNKLMAEIRNSPPAPKLVEITLWHVCSPVNLLHLLRTSFTKNTSGGLLL